MPVKIASIVSIVLKMVALAEFVRSKRLKALPKDDRSYMFLLVRHMRDMLLSFPSRCPTDHLEERGVETKRYRHTPSSLHTSQDIAEQRDESKST